MPISKLYIFSFYELLGWEGGEGIIITPSSSFSQDPKIKKTQHVKKIKIKIDLSFMFKILEEYFKKDKVKNKVIKIVVF